MGKLFVAWKKTFKNANGDVFQKYYACPKTTITIPTNVLAKRIAASSALTPGDVLSCLSSLSYEIQETLTLGDNVKVDGIGTFGVGITSEGVDDPKDLNPKMVKATKVTFKADRELTKAIKRMSFSHFPKFSNAIVSRKKK